jgi:hypothetical protein
MQSLEQGAPARANHWTHRRNSLDQKRIDFDGAARFQASPNIYSFSEKDGTTILHVERDKMYSIIGVGSLIWAKLAVRTNGMAFDEMTAYLVGEFPDTPCKQIEQDVRRILTNFQQHGFIEPVEQRRKARAHSLKNRMRSFFIYAARKITQLLLDLKLYTLAAFLGLAAINLILKLVSFSAFYNIVKGWPLREKAFDTDLTERICKAIDRATVLYPKQAMCLQRSAVTTCLLRSCGSPAHMVIGCRKIPFKSHAWAELDGKVVNDKKKVQEFYKAVDRC